MFLLIVGQQSTATDETCEEESGLQNGGQTSNVNSSSDDVFVPLTATAEPYGSPGNPIDDCGVVEIDLVSTEVATDAPISTEYEKAGSPKLAEGDQHYEMYEYGSFTGEFIDYDEPADGEHDIIIEENKAIELARKYQLMQQAQAQSMDLATRKMNEKRARGVRVSLPPPNQLQLLAASLTGKSIESFQSSNIKVTRKPGVHSNSQL